MPDMKVALSGLVICGGVGTGLFVNEKFAGVDRPAIVAATVYDPAIPFAVNTGAVAMPLAFDATVADPANVSLAPLAGAVKVTDAPGTGLLSTVPSTRDSESQPRV